MKMKTKRKALLLSLCAVLLVVASVMGTMAYLTSTDSVENTFSVGKVELTLDEAPVDETTGKATNGDRVQENHYNLLPGKDYDKDPTVHVTAGSENSWIFVKVENGLADFEAVSVDGGYKKIADQITAKGWTALNGVANVYYQPYTKSNTVTDFIVFENFKIADDANGKTGWAAIENGTKITVTAYAVQQEGFTTAEDAWTNTFGKPAQNP